ncbi:TerD family protein [Heliorestis convoluta]|uniref:Tellurium resistance protein TerA n=1 Tax=Heliorestis convoluta TaxID=356322 RepID=A0A5Q2MYL1_9FIRM|nr:TerD family protein [Heliorestis convoluta]QGG46493.1 tellurium resistance protein TerA [Heliorestis convoluta]
MTLQELYNQAIAQGKLLLPPGEWAGPLHIRHPMVIEGHRATLWSQSDPVLIIDSDQVTIRKISVEALGDRKSNQVAIKILNQRKVTFEDVKIRGHVEGVPGESEKWHLPALLELGNLPAHQASHRTFRVNVPVPCRLESKISGLRLTPEYLQAGSNVIEIAIDPLPDHSLLWGEIVLHSIFQRAITVTASTTTEAEVPENRTVWSPAERAERREEAHRSGRTNTKPHESMEPSAQASAPSLSSTRGLLKGQRIDLAELSADKNIVTIAFGWKVERPDFEVDSAVFSLDAQQKVRHDQDLLFYGNPSNDYLRLEKGLASADQEQVSIDLSKVPSDVQRLVMTLSIYEAEERRQNFSYLTDIYLTMMAGQKELFRFTVPDAFVLETAIVLGELYRYRNHWRFAAVGAGYHGGLKALCHTYGVTVI